MYMHWVYISSLTVKRNEGSIISEKVAQAMLKNNARDFWIEVKRIR